MKNQKWILFFVALAMIASTAGALTRVKSLQTLGKPGIRTEQIPGSVAMKIDLPENVQGFVSTNVPESDVELAYFPKDTSYTHRIYQAPDGFAVSSTIVMMGADRTSIHKPDYCLPGQGWQIVSKETANVPVVGQVSYDLPVSKWVVSNSFPTQDGQRQQVHGVYVFWFVADGEQTPSHYQFMRWLARDLLRKAVWQRWAYVSYFTSCTPGQEDIAFERVKKLIGGSVPQFQFPPASGK
jgi:hypothetical protein